MILRILEPRCFIAPLPTLDVALAELISEDIHQKTRVVHSTDLVMANVHSTTSTVVATAASSKLCCFNVQCHYCKKKCHLIFYCAKKKDKDARDALHILIPPKAVALESSSIPALSSSTAADLEAIV
ncbi:uncharacterized protein Fot_34606 [Forsythia ovata]|uniref:Uncharacterized protein n=1 Tax=Forsythia ovata TaxID=205694 RepID=A0ABD1SK78_9LAMI